MYLGFSQRARSPKIEHYWTKFVMAGKINKEKNEIKNQPSFRKIQEKKSKDGGLQLGILPGFLF